VPWVTSDQLAFVAEQVSHHPPVSAFYAEHANKKIQFNGHIWTKSKFLGLSIGVHNIGLGGLCSGRVTRFNRCDVYLQQERAVWNLRFDF